MVKDWGYTFITVPRWSDVTGKIAQPEDAFREPVGWKWAEDKFYKFPEVT